MFLLESSNQIDELIILNGHCLAPISYLFLALIRYFSLSLSNSKKRFGSTTAIDFNSISSIIIFFLNFLYNNNNNTMQYNIICKIREYLWN